MSIANKFCDFIHNQEKKNIPSILLISSSLQNFLIRNKKKKNQYNPKFDCICIRQLLISSICKMICIILDKLYFFYYPYYPGLGEKK